MPFDRFLIAPMKSGLQTNEKAWQIMDDAFTTLQNAYVFRGRVRKRFGTTWMETTQAGTRLRVSLGNNTNAAMPLPVNTPGHTPQLAIGQIFTLGTDIFTVWQLGPGVLTLSTNAGVSARIDSTVNPNTITFTGGALTQVNWYPALPVMGITQYESGAINDHPTFAFDTEFAYQYVTGTGWNRSGTAIWHGNDLNFFWATNWQGIITSAASQPILWVTNFNFTLGGGAPAATDDPIWTYDGTTWTAHPGSSVANGIFFLPAGGALGAGPFVQTARIIIPFKNRLVLLYTVENNNTGGAGVGTGTATQYVNRARYSFNGSPLAVNAWYEPNQTDAAGNVAAGAGFIDAPTEEQIISAEFIKDRLIVYFERSTWELAYTGNEILPFVWQKLNTELGSQSTFSTVPFDKEILTIGNTGVHSCNGSNVVRIDDKIPDQIFDFFSSGNNAPKRTAGIRDYYVELVYWIYVKPSQSLTNQRFPSQVLIYNYKTGSWAVADDCFTTFGYLEQSKDMTWASSDPLTWQQATFSWTSNVVDANHRQILAGTPEGYVLIIDEEVNRNAPSMQITNMTNPSTLLGPGYVDLNVINHNISLNDFVSIENTVGITLPIQQFYQVVSIIDVNNITIAAGDIIGTYLGGGTLARISNIMINSKQWNPYDKDGSNVYLGRIDFLVDKTEDFDPNRIQNPGITVDYYPSDTEISIIDDAIDTGSLAGTGFLETSAYNPSYYPLENFQERLTHPLYFQASGTCIQLIMYFTPAQMRNINVVWSDFELEGLILFTNKVGRMQ